MLHSSVRPSISYLSNDLPAEWNWNDVDGKSCLTKQLNQHIPQYCGSCWAHAAISSLADRIKIARGCGGDDINLSVQFVLNCGGGGGRIVQRRNAHRGVPVHQGIRRDTVRHVPALPRLLVRLRRGILPIRGHHVHPPQHVSHLRRFYGKCLLSRTLLPRAGSLHAQPPPPPPKSLPP